jgi:hypothetical protein
VIVVDILGKKMVAFTARPKSIEHIDNPLLLPAITHKAQEASKLKFCFIQRQACPENKSLLKCQYPEDLVIFQFQLQRLNPFCTAQNLALHLKIHIRLSHYEVILQNSLLKMLYPILHTKQATTQSRQQNLPQNLPLLKLTIVN